MAAWNGSNKADFKWLVSGYVLKAEKTKFTNGIQGDKWEKKKMKDNSKIWGLSYWVNDEAIY